MKELPPGMRVLAAVTAILLSVKILMVNDINCSFRQDPIEQWTATGVVVLLMIQAFKK